MDPQPIYVALSPEVLELLNDNQVDLVEELNRQGLQVRRDYRPDPATKTDGQEREIVLIILASAAAFGAVSMGIAKIIDALGRNKRVVVTERQLTPLLDGAGKVIRDPAGQPILYWRDGKRMIEPANVQEETSKVDASAGGEYGLHITLESGTGRK